MTTKNSNDSGQLKFPKQAFVILLIHFAIKFSQVVLQGALPLFFVDKLKFNESEATTTFHIFEIVLCTFSLVGGLVADSWFGKYKVILFGLLMIAVSHVTLTAASAPPLHLPLHVLTFISLSVLNIGEGMKAPCVYSFGGDQFQLPQQEKHLSLFFVQLYAISNIASVLASFISPIFRKDIRCFGELSCYSLVFAAPAIIISIGLVTFFATKTLFKIRKPQGNVTMKIMRCICHAFSRKWKSAEKKDRLLNYATDKYESEFIEDIRSALQAFMLILPTTMVFALYAAEVTTMTFQASRMNGEVAGYLIKPDQIQIVRAISLIVALPAFHYYIYPFLAKYFKVDTHLKKMTIGLCLAALSYYVASIVEFNLENSYAQKPMEGSAYLRIYNTVDCKAMMTIDEKKITIDELEMWENLDVAVSGSKLMQYSADFEGCRLQQFSSKRTSGSLEVLEMQANSWALTEHGLGYKFIDRNNKSLSGNPLVRALMYRRGDIIENNVTLKIRMNKELLSEVPISENITKSEYVEVVHGLYDMYLNDQQVQSDVPLKIGGVYTVLGHIANSSKVAKVVTVTPPNSMHIFWILPQQILLSGSMIMFDPICIDFLYSQAPSSMKAFMQSYPDISLGIGNLMVVAITSSNFFQRKVFLFLFYAVLMTTATTVFALLCRSYKYRPTANDDAQQDSAE